MIWIATASSFQPLEPTRRCHDAFILRVRPLAPEAWSRPPDCLKAGALDRQLPEHSRWPVAGYDRPGGQCRDQGRLNPAVGAGLQKEPHRTKPSYRCPAIGCGDSIGRDPHGGSCAATEAAVGPVTPPRPPWRRQTAQIAGRATRTRRRPRLHACRAIARPGSARGSAAAIDELVPELQERAIHRSPPLWRQGLRPRGSV
jgi:hypothetical protein